ncbi:unnamed protein product [Symbiodinium natans]|uniref:Uncharacterized protein n=1 Tax=Symbiodinium natans TaxID=878477 RepID=A0A812J9P6_9DINO|nr:unnamed protein product [Symbiodinium natans]
MALEAALEPKRDWQEFKAWMALQPRTPRRREGEILSYRSTLAIAGLRITDMSDDVKPASTSLHESALYKHPVPVCLPALEETRQKWERDRVCQSVKYGGSYQPSTSKARFTVDLPTGSQNRKYCFEAKVDPTKSVLASQIAKEQQQAQEEERRMTRRNSLMKMMGGAVGVQDTPDPAKRYRIVEKLINRNKFQDDTLEKIWEELEQAPAAPCARAIALKMMQKVVAASGCPSSLEAPIFNWMRSKFKQAVKANPSLTLSKEGFLEFCKFAGLLLEYETPEAERRQSYQGIPEELVLLDD